MQLPYNIITLHVDIFSFTKKPVTTNSIIQTRTIELHCYCFTLNVGLGAFAPSHRILFGATLSVPLTKNTAVSNMMVLERNIAVPIGVFKVCATNIMKREVISKQTLDHKFRSNFGISLELTSDIWALLPKIRGGSPKHLLRALLFLRIYDTEDINTSLIGSSKDVQKMGIFVY